MVFLLLFLFLPPCTPFSSSFCKPEPVPGSGSLTGHPPQQPPSPVLSSSPWLFSLLSAQAPAPAGWALTGTCTLPRACTTKFCLSPCWLLPPSLPLHHSLSSFPGSLSRLSLFHVLSLLIACPSAPHTQPQLHWGGPHGGGTFGPRCAWPQRPWPDTFPLGLMLVSKMSSRSRGSKSPLILPESGFR